MDTIHITSTMALVLVTSVETLYMNKEMMGNSYYTQINLVHEIIRRSADSLHIFLLKATLSSLTSIRNGRKKRRSPATDNIIKAGLQAYRYRQAEFDFLLWIFSYTALYFANGSRIVLARKSVHHFCSWRNTKYWGQTTVSNSHSYNFDG